MWVWPKERSRSQWELPTECQGRLAGASGGQEHQFMGAVFPCRSSSVRKGASHSPCQSGRLTGQARRALIPYQHSGYCQEMASPFPPEASDCLAFLVNSPNFSDLTRNPFLLAGRPHLPPSPSAAGRVGGFHTV